jgi:flagellar basal-body rod modification protein FlgD
MSITSLASATSAAHNSSQAATNSLSDNFDTFLTLLTTQLQNQNPLDPMKADQFTQQLVQYSQVEQSIQTNKNLETLIAAQTAQGFSNMVSYLGKNVTMDTNVAGLEDGNANWNYILGSNADEVKIVIKDDSGDVVYTETLEGEYLKKGEHKFNWDGLSSSGAELPEGAYSMTIAANSGDSSVDTATLVEGTVETVETVAGEQWLVVKGVDVPLGTLTKVSEKPASENDQGA